MFRKLLFVVNMLSCNISMQVKVTELKGSVAMVYCLVRCQDVTS